jgi:hypothetical protein
MLADPGSGIAAAQPAGGNQGSGWLPIFLPASGSGCGLLSFWLRVTANFRFARSFTRRESSKFFDKYTS